MKRADEILAEAAKTFKERNAVYGDNWSVVGNAMAAFFPNGVTLKTADDHNRFHIFMLKIVKLSRYVLNWDKGGHQDSIHDDMVYSAMLEMIDARIAERRNRPIRIEEVAELFEKAIEDFIVKAPSKDELDKFTTQFRICDKCSAAVMCTTEEHCDRVSNGYR